jgi:CheY-like chemotaxis protein
MLANPNPDEPLHVLVVEDEPLSRIYASNLVEDAGFVPIQLPTLTKQFPFWKRERTFA